MTATHAAEIGAWRTELRDAGRAAAGGMLFGVPLLYTMEVWWIGSYTSASLMLVVLAATFLLVLVLNRTAGFRSTRDVSFKDALFDTVEALGIGAVCVAFVLVLIREITLDMEATEVVGKIVYESTPFTIGVGLARHFLSGERGGGGGVGDADADSDADAGADGGQAVGQADDEHELPINATLADVGGTLLGAVFIAFNIAPTDEVPMIAAELSPPMVLALMAASVAISYVIVFQAGFGNQQRRFEQQGILQRPVTETVAAYLFSLVVAASLLWFFQRIAFGDPFDFTLTQVIVLGLPAAVGGAAGRLAV